MDQPLAVSYHPERNASAPDGAQRVREGLAMAQQIEQAAAALEELKGAKTAAIDRISNDHRKKEVNAEARRALTVSYIGTKYSEAGLVAPPQIGHSKLAPPGTAGSGAPPVISSIDEFQQEVSRISAEIRAMKFSLQASEQGTRYATLVVWVATCFFGLILIGLLKQFGLVVLAIPLGYHIFIGQKKKAKEDQLLQLAKDLGSKAKALDLAAAIELDATLRSIASSLQAASQAVNVEFDKKRQAIMAELEAQEAKLGEFIKELEIGVGQGDWSDSAWQTWQPAKSAASSIRFGSLLPPMPKYRTAFPEKPPIRLPALLNFQSGKGVIIEATRGLEEAHRLAQSIVLRLLATVPPAGVRFTFIDPLSLGRNVAGFMALEKFEPSLVGGKAWSDPQHIEKALAEITEHMETMIQKYLREDYKTIEAYNQSARVKEAYRIVLIFDFPVNFTDSSAKRLASIVRNGPQCGVFPVVIVDSSKPMPHGIGLSDLEQFAPVFRFPERFAPPVLTPPAPEGALA